MDRTWQSLVALAFVILAIYAGFEIYNSISGGNVEFNKTVTPIDNNLGVDVLEHIEITQERLIYKGVDQFGQREDQQIQQDTEQ